MSSSTDRGMNIRLGIYDSWLRPRTRVAARVIREKEGERERERERYPPIVVITSSKRRLEFRDNVSNERKRVARCFAFEAFARNRFYGSSGIRHWIARIPLPMIAFFDRARCCEIVGTGRKSYGWRNVFTRGSKDFSFRNVYYLDISRNRHDRRNYWIFFEVS